MAEYVVRHAERLRKADVAHCVKQAVVGNDDERIHGILQVHDAVDRVVHAHLALKGKGFCDDANSEDPHLLSAFGHDGRRARSRAAAHACGDEHQIRTLERLRDGVPAFLSSLAANLRIGARTKPLGQLFSNLDLLPGARKV